MAQQQVLAVAATANNLAATQHVQRPLPFIDGFVPRGANFNAYEYYTDGEATGVIFLCGGAAISQSVRFHSYEIVDDNGNIARPSRPPSPWHGGWQRSNSEFGPGIACMWIFFHHSGDLRNLHMASVFRANADSLEWHGWDYAHRRITIVKKYQCVGLNGTWTHVRDFSAAVRATPPPLPPPPMRSSTQPGPLGFVIIDS